jgi:hypothetical protein
MSTSLEEVVRLLIELKEQQQVSDAKAETNAAATAEHIRILGERMAVLEARSRPPSPSASALAPPTEPTVAPTAQVEVQPQPSTTLEHPPTAPIAATERLTITNAADTSLDAKSLGGIKNCSTPAVSTDSYDVDQSNHSEALQALPTFQHSDLRHWPLVMSTGMLLSRIAGAGLVILQFDPGGVC